MAYVTTTVTVGLNWTFITNKIAMLQFNNKMQMVLNGGGTPTDTIGFMMDTHEKYINNSVLISVWARLLPGAPAGVDSIRLAEDVI